MAASPSPSNPFATRWTRPGAIPYRFPRGTDLGDLIQRLKDARWRGQIVGPHGSGKTTLLAQLKPEWKQWGRVAVIVTPGRTDWRAALAAARRQADAPTQLIVDGYEQLGLLARCQLHVWGRNPARGLLVTTHRPVRLPIVHRTQSSPATAQYLVRKLTQNTSTVIDPCVVEAAFHAHGGNMREMFFALYDVTQQSARSEHRPVPAKAVRGLLLR